MRETEYSASTRFYINIYTGLCFFFFVETLSNIFVIIANVHVFVKMIVGQCWALSRQIYQIDYLDN